MSERVARGWHAATGAVVIASVVAQVVVLAGLHNGVPAFTRYVRFLSYFTIQSNLLVLFAAVTLVRAPDRDGRGWRIARLDGLAGIAVTGLIFVTVLRPLYEFHGIDAWTNAGFHYVSPVLAVLGWVLFGPRPRIDWSTAGWAMAWPLAWVAYTLVHGAVSHWYPYPFIDVAAHGYARVALNCLGVAVLLAVVVVVPRALDRRMPPSLLAGSSRR